MEKPIKLIGILCLGVMAMSSASIIIRQAQSEQVSSIVIASYRLSIATLILTIPLLHQRAFEEYAKLNKKFAGIILVSGIFLGLHFATWITSLTYTSVASSAALVTTTPVWIGITSPFLLGERNSPVSWCGISIAIAGSVIIALGDWNGAITGTAWGNLLAVIGAIFAAGYMIIGRTVREVLSLTAYLWLVYGIAAIFLIILALIQGVPLWGYSINAYIWMGLSGLIPQLIGHSAANYALRQTSANFVSIAILGEPIGSSLLAIVFLQEHPASFEIMGGLLIIAGIAVASTAEKTLIKSAH